MDWAFVFIYFQQKNLLLLSQFRNHHISLVRTIEMHSNRIRHSSRVFWDINFQIRLLLAQFINSTDSTQYSHLWKTDENHEEPHVNLKQLTAKFGKWLVFIIICNRNMYLIRSDVSRTKFNFSSSLRFITSPINWLSFISVHLFREQRTR